MLIVIQPLKKYLTEHESETLSTCHDKYLASCQDAQQPLSKTASLPEGKCILLLYLVLLSTVQYPREIHLRFGSTSLLPRYLKFTAVRESAEHNSSQAVIATASDNPVVGYAIGKGISFSLELMSVSYPHCLFT